MNQARTNQGGSVVSFLVIGAILVGITLVGVYFVQQRNSAAPIASSPSPSPSVSTPVAPQPTSSPAPSQSVGPSSSPKPSASPVPSSHPTTGTAPTEHLPQTGPAEDLLLSAMPIAVLVGSTISYLVSRRARYNY